MKDVIRHGVKNIIKKIEKTSQTNNADDYKNFIKHILKL